MSQTTDMHVPILLVTVAIYLRNVEHYASISFVTSVYFFYEFFNCDYKMLDQMKYVVKSGGEYALKEWR